MAGFNYAIHLIFLLISFRVAGALEAIQAIVEGKAEYNLQFISLFQANVLWQTTNHNHIHMYSQLT